MNFQVYAKIEQQSENCWKSSRGRKIARMARISAIFGPNWSCRHENFKNSNERNEHKVFEISSNNKSERFSNKFKKHVKCARCQMY